MSGAYVCIKDCYIDRVYREGEIIRNTKLVSFAPVCFKKLKSEIMGETQEEEAMRILGYPLHDNSNIAEPMTLTDMYKQQKPPTSEAFVVKDDSETVEENINPLTGEPVKQTKTTKKTVKQ